MPGDHGRNHWHRRAAWWRRGILRRFRGGAAPGAVAGAALRAEAGEWILAALGLKALAEFVVEGLPAIGRTYWSGIREAWLAAAPPSLPQGQPHINAFAIRHAASLLARGHVAMFVLLLMAIVAYVSKGRGSMRELAEKASHGRLGRKFGEWLLRNESKLRADPRLRPPEPVRSAPAPDVVEAPAARARARREPAPEPESKAPPTMPRKKVPCFKTQKLPPGKFAEMDRQLAAQQNGLNKMTVQDYLDGRARYAVDKRKGAGTAALKARKKYQARMERLLTAAHVQARTDPRTAKTLAQEAVADHFSTQDALHNPDMVAGGRSTVIDGMGDSQANRTIGRQWNKGAFEGMTRVNHMDDAALKVPVAERGSTLMNVDLHRCK
ncbi:MAG TPA: polymorphic toxin type 15 domain-containing protein [Dokdonella sp.]|uniref:DUF6861 domain-containing protein n=1 Tax=Dokdonella sp. TaxID=2291710 RepID=UPI002D7EB7AB|nr:polymorphic toxin type 15 domain-containing protein [Dokdonella sp.]HET9032634.1 polymorphic toxin type 15 domain-containing protein [Dokdonella sp.]